MTDLGEIGADTIGGEMNRAVERTVERIVSEAVSVRVKGAESGAVREAVGSVNVVGGPWARPWVKSYAAHGSFGLPK